MKIQKTLLFAMLLTACTTLAEEQKICFELNLKNTEMKERALSSVHGKENKDLRIMTSGEIIASSKVYDVKDIQSKDFVSAATKGDDPFAIAIAVGTIVFNTKDNIRTLQTAYTTPRYKEDKQIDQALFLCEKFKMKLKSSKALFSQTANLNGEQGMNILVESECQRSSPDSKNTTIDVVVHFFIPLIKREGKWKTTYAETEHSKSYKSLERLIDMAELEKGSLVIRTIEKHEVNEPQAPQHNKLPHSNK